MQCSRMWTNLQMFASSMSCLRRGIENGRNYVRKYERPAMFGWPFESSLRFNFIYFDNNLQKNRKFHNFSSSRSIETAETPIDRALKCVYALALTKSCLKTEV